MFDSADCNLSNKLFKLCLIPMFIFLCAHLYINNINKKFNILNYLNLENKNETKNI